MFIVGLAPLSIPINLTLCSFNKLTIVDYDTNKSCSAHCLYMCEVCPIAWEQSEWKEALTPHKIKSSPLSWENYTLIWDHCQKTYEAVFVQPYSSKEYDQQNQQQTGMNFWNRASFVTFFPEEYGDRWRKIFTDLQSSETSWTLAKIQDYCLKSNPTTASEVLDCSHIPVQLLWEELVRWSWRKQTHLTFGQTERTALFLGFGFREVLAPQDEICCISNARLLGRSVLFYFHATLHLCPPYFAG